MADRTLDFLFNHVFLPPKLPHRDDNQKGGGRGDESLVEQLTEYCRLFRDLNPAQHYQQWSTILRTLRTFGTMHRNTKSLSVNALKSAFSDARGGSIIILHVAMQNSGLIIRKVAGEYIIESFEASPRSAEVLAAEKSLRWDFPSRAVAVPSAEFEEASFQTCLAEFLEKASVEPVKRFAAVALKAGSNASESRDTVTPAVVGQLLMSILLANGRNQTATLSRKRVRDDVCWSDGAENPWRRSATWLVLRVGIQRSLCFLLGGDLGLLHYKFFMAFVHSTLSERICAETSSLPDRLAHARTKLARRVAKLQHQKDISTPQAIRSIDSLFSTYGGEFSKTLRTLNDRLNHDWGLVRYRTTKRISPLPRRADTDSTVLSLIHSRGFLQRILEEALFVQPRSEIHLGERDRSTPRDNPDDISVSDYLFLAGFEGDLRSDVRKPFGHRATAALDSHCVQFGILMQQYQRRASPAYKSDPEQLSSMIVTLLEMWQAIDSIAIILYPLLADYEPEYPRDILYPLQIAQLSDMQRVQDVENHLEHRRSFAKPSLPSVFRETSPQSFAVRYFDQSQEMQKLAETIKDADGKARAKKEDEWAEKSREYEAVMKQAAEKTCLFIEDALDPLKRHHDDRRCLKHQLERRGAKMRIQMHEAALPDDDNQMKALVFELLLPTGFAAWRDATWQLIQLGRPNTIPDGDEPRCLLRNYQGLSMYMGPTESSITLGSRRKSFMNTHYTLVSFPTPLDKVCMPQQLRFGLYDQSKGLWTSKHRDKPSFANLCAPYLPPRSVYGSLRKYLHPTFEGKPSSANEIIASQTRCPNSLTPTEFITFQDLRFGNRIQWIRLLRELASSNLNFGTLEVGILVTELALVVGPPHEQSLLRAGHWVFEDLSFCQALTTQIQRRLESIAENWREGQTVECLLVLLQRVWSLSTFPEARKEAENLTLYVRQVTHNWSRSLRQEICNATSTDTAQKRSQDALLATLLCRKTFNLEAADPNNLIEADMLAIFLECSFTLKDNLPANEVGFIGKMPVFLKTLYVSDLKLVHRLESQLCSAILSMNQAVDQAVNSVWADTEDQSTRVFTPWTLLSNPYDGWVTAQSISINGLLEQSVFFDMIEGTLLIDGQPLGHLPDDYTKQEFFRRIFGNRVFMTYPSSIPGMSYQLASRYEEHQIHFGFRDGVPFMRARLPRQTLELVPPTVFLSRVPKIAPDLPLPLINDCVHWLVLASRRIEIRSFSTMWRHKQRNWVIDLQTNQAHRGQLNQRYSLLVDPRSSIFDRIATIIEPFEHRHRMTVFQPQRGNVSLHLPGLELSFRVNWDGLLESQQLRAFVDSDQDAGTLYGIESKLVLRDSMVPEDRSIIVAMGAATIEQSGTHVRVRMKHNGFYARFLVNSVLGRLECASEPRLIYFKAYCHAVTSFVLPDPLTRRTGTDEAIHCLRSGNAQPWAPVDTVAYGILSNIADFTPKRVYYPEKLKVLQKVVWKDHLSSTVQHDEFRPIVRGILQQCLELHRFHLGSAKPPSDDQGGDEHLLLRARVRRDAFRAVQVSRASLKAKDLIYAARDCGKSPSAKNAYESASLIKRWSSLMRVNPNLSAILQEWPLIQGYSSEFELFIIADLINVNLAANWGSLFTLCQKATKNQDRFRLMFLFATMSFDANVDMTIIRTLIAVAIMEDFQTLSLPRHPSFSHFRRGQIPNADFLIQLTKPYRTPYPGDERALISVTMHSKQRRKLEMAQFKHEQQSEDSCKAFAHHVLVQWPVQNPSIDDMCLEDVALLDAGMAYREIKPEWERLIANHELSEHLGCVENILKTCQATKPSPTMPVIEGEQQFFPTSVFSNVNPTLQLLLNKLSKHSSTVNGEAFNDHSNVARPSRDGRIITAISASVSPHAMPSTISLRKVQNEPVRPQSSNLAVINELQSIIRPFANSEDPVRQAYGRDLQNSLRALEGSRRKTSREILRATPDIEMTEIAATISSSAAAVNSQFESIHMALTQDEDWLKAGALLPSITPVSLLEMVRPLGFLERKSTARDVIIKYGQSIVQWQHMLRIRGATLRKDTIQFANETQVSDHNTWQARRHPDWLLLEIDFNLCIRPDQYEVARAMASPSSNSSFCLQMNMGQGKSSVIIPMVVSELANAKNLVRVVVPRPLLLQTAQLLQARLGGLIGRKLKHVPFSRRSSTATGDIEAYQDLHTEMLRDGGIVLSLPEHMLSFQLSGLQELLNGHIEQANYMMKLQEWLMSECRNILDECDHMLAVKTQLIYPSGAQTMVDGHPDRWKLVQDLLKLVKAHLGSLRRDFPKSIEVIDRSRGTFPTVYLLTPEVKDALMHRLIDAVVSGDGGILPIDACSPDDIASVNSFLREAQFPKATALKIAGVFKENTNARQRLLLLRGLFVHKILLLGLSKRWNVQYGIDTRRDPIAVPYKAKGIASDQAEFGHPDVSIILTCLSFYYSGLTLLQFQQALNQLLKSEDEPGREFDSWIREIPSFPDSLRSWSSINVDDETQCAQLWGHLRHQMVVINYFLNHHVFPRHSRVFERKLVSSGWDIATKVSSTGGNSFSDPKENFQPGADVKSAIDRSKSLTVGFSGTNDNKALLPLNVLQDDLPGLAHTNADVLTYLLQPRNRRYVSASRPNGKRLTEKDFLYLLKNNSIRMLLDAGAQILEMNNQSLAKAWLEIENEAEAAVFFGEDDRVRVIYRDGRSQPLAGSPFLNNLGSCVVYLDEAHTRGVDLKMPADAVAALTLGIQQTKDHTVQAAMRLRQLAISQSIVFVAPPEVHQSILNFRGKAAKYVIDSHDVIVWLLEQTCCNIEQLQPLYISQGLEYCRRRLAAQRNPDASSQQDQRKAYLKVLEQPERYSLENLYTPDQKIRSRPIDTRGFPEIAGYVEKLDEMKKGLKNTGDTVQALTHQEVEQEREVQIEVETVREVKKPLHATPTKQQPLHKDVRSFAETGRLVANSQAYQQAFVALRQTALGRRLGISDTATTSRLFVSHDFNNVVEVQWGKPLDEYSRPVHWILWSMTTDTALIVSDFEADAVLPLIRDRRPPSTYLITYAAPVTRAMLVFDTLRLYTVPSLPASWRAPIWLVRDLGIFAGRLYFDFDEQSHATYQALGLPPPTSTSENLPIEPTEMDLWNELPFGDPRPEVEEGPFSENPLLFMQEWLAIRRKGQDFSQSMVGELIRGRRLERGDVKEEKEEVDSGEDARVEELEGDVEAEDE